MVAHGCLWFYVTGFCDLVLHGSTLVVVMQIPHDSVGDSSDIDRHLPGYALNFNKNKMLIMTGTQIASNDYTLLLTTQNCDLSANNCHLTFNWMWFSPTKSSICQNYGHINPYIAI